MEWKIDNISELNVNPVKIVDNMADLGHFVPIHGATNWQYFANEFNDHVTYHSAGHWTLTKDANDMLMLDTWYTGPGFLQSEMAGAFDSFITIADTPIEEDLIRAWHALMVKVHGGDRERTENDLVVAAWHQTGSRLAFAQDEESRANKSTLINPLAIPNDEPYGTLRHWYSQFHNPRDKAAGIQQKVDGTVVTLNKRTDTDAA